MERKHTKTLGDAVKAVLRRRFIVVNACIQESQMNNPILPPKESEKEEPPTVIRRKKITQIRVKINDEIETKMTFHQTYIAGSNILVYLKSSKLHEEKCMPAKVEKCQTSPE